jgi:hypothetical protein
MEAGLPRDGGAMQLGAERPVDALTEHNTQAFLMNSYKVRRNCPREAPQRPTPARPVHRPRTAVLPGSAGLISMDHRVRAREGGREARNGPRVTSGKGVRKLR